MPDAAQPRDAAVVEDASAPVDASCDHDGDGYLSPACGGGDCDDERADVHPRAVERCDGVDRDCDGISLEGLTVRYRDLDGDGYAGAEVTMTPCPPPADTFETSSDCDEDDPGVHPGVHDGAPEACNGRDDDCNGVVDDACACTPPASAACGPLDPSDPSGATFLVRGACAPGTQTCAGPSWSPVCTGATYPQAEECTAAGAAVLDEDCDGEIDETGAGGAACGCESFAATHAVQTVDVTRGPAVSALGLMLTLVDAAPASAGVPASATIDVSCAATGVRHPLHLEMGTVAPSTLASPWCATTIELVDADVDHALVSFQLGACG